MTSSSMTSGAARLLRGLETIMVAVATVFFVLRFWHLKADFPNHSIWRDWSKYTDEGWYGSAAIRLYQTGHWNLPGDFNPGAALPVWPALEAVVFGATGVSVVAARALTTVICGGIMVVAYWLLLRSGNGGRRSGSLAAALGVLLLGVSTYFYVFSRLAILEPLLILLGLLGMLVASSLGAEMRRGATWRARPRLRYTVALGCLLPVMVLTKTTGVFLFPAIFWMLWGACGFRLRPFLSAAIPPAAIGALGWAAYFGLVVRPHYLEDYRYLFTANTYTGITWVTFPQVMNDVFTYGVWFGTFLYPMELLAIFLTLTGQSSQRFRRNPLPVALLLWVAGYVAFLTYHANLQPRYYLVMAVPLILLVSVVFERVMGRAFGSPEASGSNPAGLDSMLMKGVACVAIVAVTGIVLNDARETLRCVLHPEYTYLSAAEQIHNTVERERTAHPGHSAMVLSISGADLSLMTGLPSICDDFGTMALPQRIATYRPGWFATWNEVDDDKMEALDPDYTLVRVGTYPVMDDAERNLLILYRLDARPVKVPAGAAKSGL